ncbi:hypothetical protein Vretifemale_13527, partial [Volvox reticuliferus]
MVMNNSNDELSGLAVVNEDDEVVIEAAKWMPRVELKCRDNNCLLLGGHRIATNTIMVWCTCLRPDSAHPDNSRLMALDAWVIEHCMGEKLDDYEDDEDEEGEAPGRVDALCMEEALVVRAGRNVLPKQVPFRQFLSSSLVAQGGNKALKGASFWVYWYDQPIPTPNCPEYGGMYRTWAPGSLTRKGLGVWYRAKIMRCDTGTGVVQIKYDIDASTDSMYLLVAFAHFGTDVPARGTRPDVLPDMDLVRNLGLPQSAVANAGAAKGKDRSGGGAAAAAATAGASKKGTVPMNAAATAAAAVKKPAAAATPKAPLAAADERKHAAAAKPAPSAAAAAATKASNLAAAAKPQAVKQPLKPEQVKSQKGLTKDNKSVRAAAATAIKATAAAAAPPSGPKPPHDIPSKAPGGGVLTKGPQTPSKRPASSPPPASPRSQRPAKMTPGAAQGASSPSKEPAAMKSPLSENRQPKVRHELELDTHLKMLPSRRDSPAQRAAAEVVAMPGSAPRLAKRRRHEFEAVALALADITGFVVPANGSPWPQPPLDPSAWAEWEGRFRSGRLGGGFCGWLCDKKEQVPVPVYNTEDQTRPPPFEYLSLKDFEGQLSYMLTAATRRQPAVVDALKGIRQIGNAAKPPWGQACGRNYHDRVRQRDLEEHGDSDSAGRLMPEASYGADGRLLVTRPMGLHECSSSSCSDPRCRTNMQLSHGVRRPLEVFRSRDGGWSLRCSEPLQAGDFVAPLLGRLTTTQQLMEEAAAAAAAGGERLPRAPDVLLLNHFFDMWEAVFARGLNWCEQHVPLWQLPPNPFSSTIRRTLSNCN